MSKIKLHISYLSPTSPEVLALMPDDKYELSFQKSSVSREDDLAAAIADKDAIVFGVNHYYSENVLRRAKNLKIMSFVGSGYENFVDTKAATELGIAVANTPGANSKSVAELSVGLALDALRKITLTNKTDNRPIARELTHLKIGLIGYGHINKHIYKMLRDGFGADVQFWNRTPIEGGVALDKVLSESDIIFVALATNNETKGFIDADKIAKMKDGVILINPARPDLINEPALMKALQSGKISTYAMDGRLKDSELLTLGDDKFILTPHIAARTTEGINNMEKFAFLNIKDFFEIGTSKNIVNL